MENMCCSDVPIPRSALDGEISPSKQSNVLTEAFSPCNPSSCNPSLKCPLPDCHHVDSALHILSGCQCPVICDM
eukprot:302115-Pelagomonas_calceolata.AAC.1